jgi:hypothetical protein
MIVSKADIKDALNDIVLLTDILNIKVSTNNEKTKFKKVINIPLCTNDKTKVMLSKNSGMIIKKERYKNIIDKKPLFVV